MRKSLINLFFIFTILGFIRLSEQLPTVILPLLGNTTHGQYYTSLDISNKTFHLSISTKIPFISLPCSSSKNTNQKHEMLNTENSQEENHKIFYFDYPDKSLISGKIINNVPLIDKKPFSIGCTMIEKGKFYFSNSDGIFGIGEGENSVMNQLLSHGMIDKKIISVCLSDEGGYLSFGGFDASKNVDSFISYLPTVQDQMFEVEANFFSIYKDGDSSGYKSSCLFEVSSTLSYFPSEIYIDMISRLSEICSMDENSVYCKESNKLENFKFCFEFGSINEMKKALTEIFPNFFFSLGGYTFTWTPEDYVVTVKKENRKIVACLGFLGTGEDKIIFGQNFMKRFNFIFDKDNHRVGVVRANCNLDDWSSYREGKVYQKKVLPTKIRQDNPFDINKIFTDISEDEKK